MTNAELIELLEQHNPDAEVRLAIQPSWPLQFGVADVVVLDDDVVYVVQGSHPEDTPYAPGRVFGGGDSGDDDWG